MDSSLDAHLNSKQNVHQNASGYTLKCGILASTRTICAGFVVGGPLLAAVLAVAANYGSKRDNEAGQAVRAVSANAIEAFNFLTSINSKYDVSGECTLLRLRLYYGALQ